MAQAKVFFGGVPTDLDVRVLREAFPDSELKVGQVLSYADVEKALKIGRDSCRYKTVTGRWRRLVLKDSGIIIGTKRSEGFLVLDDHEKLELSCQKLRSAVRSTRVSFRVAGYVERKALTVEEQKRYDVVTAKDAAIMAAAQLRGRGADLPKFLT